MNANSKIVVAFLTSAVLCLQVAPFGPMTLLARARSNGNAKNLARSFSRTTKSV
jgi:hypothetical protein